MLQILFPEQKCFDFFLLFLFGTAEMSPGLWQQDLECGLAGLDVSGKKKNVTCVEKGCTEVGVNGEKEVCRFLGRNREFFHKKGG